MKCLHRIEWLEPDDPVAPPRPLLGWLPDRQKYLKQQKAFLCGL